MEEDDLNEFVFLEEDVHEINWCQIDKIEREIFDQRALATISLPRNKYFADLTLLNPTYQEKHAYFAINGSISKYNRIATIKDDLILSPIINDIPYDPNQLIKICVTFNNSSLTMNYEIKTPIKSIANNIFKHINENPAAIDKYLVRIGYVEQYITDVSLKLYQLEYIKKCLNNKTDGYITIITYEQYMSNYLQDIVFIKNIKQEIDLNHFIKCDSFYPTAFINENYSIKINHIDSYDIKNLPIDLQSVTYEEIQFFITANLHYGQLLLVKSLHTQPVNYNLEWNTTLTFDIKINQIPKEAILNIKLYAYHPGKKDNDSYFKQLFYGSENKVYELGWINYQFSDFNQIITSGLFNSSLNLSKPSNYYTYQIGHRSYDNPVINIEIISPCSTGKIYRIPYNNDIKETPDNKPDIIQIKHIIEIIDKYDGFYIPNNKEQHLLWTFKSYIKNNIPDGLPMLLLSVKWSNVYDVAIFEKFLDNWLDIDSLTALFILNKYHPNFKARKIAIDQLVKLKTADFLPILPQLIEVIKFEQNDNSYVIKQIILKACSDVLIGYQLFWLLKTEFDNEYYQNRIKICAILFLNNCDQRLQHQLQIASQYMQKLTTIAKYITTISSSHTRNKVLKAELSDMVIYEPFRLPNNPSFIAHSICVDKCKVMTSNTVPLWLVFKNDMDHYCKLIFKVGDDLRIDMLVLQLFKYMDKLWKNNDPSLDLYLQTYQTITISPEVGIIEVVDGSHTVSNIQSSDKSLFDFTSAFSDRALYDWLWGNNCEIDGNFDIAVLNFVKSCAAYCIATYVLGIGDRHNDNIMCHKNGIIFHIDFGYFLGEKTTILGVSRENAPFILTEDFINVMKGVNSKEFKYFTRLCLQGYNVLRKNHKLFTVMCLLLNDSGIDQLMDVENIKYPLKRLHVDFTEKQANLHFTKLITQAINSYSTQVNFALHMAAGNIKSQYDSLLQNLLL